MTKAARRSEVVKGQRFEILGRDRGRSPKNPRWMVDRSEFGGSFSYQAAPFLVFAYIWVMSWIEAKQIWWQCLVELRVAVFLLNSTGFGASICWSKPRWCTVYSRAVPKSHPSRPVWQWNHRRMPSVKRAWKETEQLECMGLPENMWKLDTATQHPLYSIGQWWCIILILSHCPITSAIWGACPGHAMIKVYRFIEQLLLTHM